MARPVKLARISVGLLACALALAFGRWFYQHEQREFLATLHGGMKVTELVTGHGRPNQVLKPGDELSQWGGYPGYKVEKTTYVYLMGPGHIHRVVITIADDEVVDFQLHRT